MVQVKSFRPSPLAALAVLLGAPLAAPASEGLIPYIPGITTGIPLGASPPPGLYVTDTAYDIWGEVKDGSGKTIPVKVDNYSDNIILHWSSPYEVLGAHYSAGLIEIVASHGVDATGVGGPSTRSLGAFNTVLQPIGLSWSLGDGLFVSNTQTVYIKDGDFEARNGVRDQTSYANNYWTYEPSVAISYLKDGLDLTANLLYDVNTTNRKTDYHSGSTFYADLTAAQTVGDFTFGVIGAVVQQTENDRQHGAVVGNGNEVSHLMVGPMAAYKLDRFTLMVRYLDDLRPRNDIALSAVYLSIGTHF